MAAAVAACGGGRVTSPWRGKLAPQAWPKTHELQREKPNQLYCRCPFWRPLWGYGATSRSPAVARSAAGVSGGVKAEAGATRAPLPLLDPAKRYSHASPGVCDTCTVNVETRRAWADLLLGQLPSHRANAERTMQYIGAGVDYMSNYWLWEEDYVGYLENAVKDQLAGATLLDMVDEKERLLRARSLEDLFACMKASENQVALPLYQEVVAGLEAVGPEPAERLRYVVEVALAGNLFDAGAAAAVQNIAFCESVDEECDLPEDNPDEVFALDASQLHSTFLKAQSKVARPPGGWRFDDLSKLAERAADSPWRAAIVFCDNAGADTMGATLLARHLASLGTTVALAANSTAALNDITHSELQAFLACASENDLLLAALVAEGKVACVPSGQPSTLLNMAACGPELNQWVEAQGVEPEEWLVVLDGMGRSLESNWEAWRYVLPGVDVLSLAMVKSEINALRLGAEVYDCVVRLNTGK